MMETQLPYTGKEFLDSLDDGREVWIYGERIKNITGHPGFRNTARMIARLYDALHRDRAAIGSEFGGRHELYEINYAGSHEEIRIDALRGAIGSGQYERWKGFADRCMTEYDLDGWTVPDLVNPDDVSALGRP